MADQSRTLSAAFPTPPPYYKHFTKDNVSQLQQLRQLRKGAISDEIDLSVVPAELRNLIPPDPPAEGHYKSFGIEHDLSRPDQSLEQAGIQQLYPRAQSNNGEAESVLDPTPHMLTITRSILLNFLELVGILSVNPSDAADKVEHLQTLFYNVHDLINQYRPHQARESLILMMEEQLDKFHTEFNKVREGRQKIGDVLRTIQEGGIANQQDGPVSKRLKATTGVVNGPANGDAGHVDGRPNLQRRQWMALEDELG